MSETQEAPSATDRRGHRTRWIVGAIVVILVIFVVVRLLERKKPVRAAPPQVVKVSKAARGDMPETLSELGTVSPVATVTVLPQLSGYLTEVGYKEGQDVKKGQFLAQIDPRQYEIDLRAGASRASQGPGLARPGALGPLPLSRTTRSKGHRRTDGDRSGIHRQAG